MVAEMSANHLGTLSRALELVDAAAAAGADAVKLQTWTPGTMVLDRDYVLESGPWAGRNLAGLYEQAFTPWDWHEPIFNRAYAKGLVPFTSVFDLEALRFLEDLGCPMYKIASFEMVDLPLITAVARTGKPMIMSTGMADILEIELAVNAAHKGAADGPPDLTLLRCTSDYPANPSDANLKSMGVLQLAFGHSVGLSDHTPGIGVAVVATAMGAEVIEKHLTLQRIDGGPDAGFSLEPAEFAMMVTECRRVVGCMGDGVMNTLSAEDPQRALRRSLHWAADRPAGHVLTAEDFTTARPANGAPISHLPALIGYRLAEDVEAGQPVMSFRSQP